MTLSFFDQFMSPTLLGVPLTGIALFFPWLIFFNPAIKWFHGRFVSIQAWLINRFAWQLFAPIHVAGHKWALLLTSILLYLMTLNLLGMLPYTFTPTTQLSLNLALAVPLWLATVLLGFRHLPKQSLAHFLPEGTPVPLIPILILIETISLFIRPIALGVRLTANLTAGHLLMQLIATASFVLLPIMPPVALLTTILLFLLAVLELAVAVIQAYVFVLLVSLYLAENI